jgi:uncharacterized protein (DUF1330 family)
MFDEQYVDPSRVNFDTFKALDRTTPILMLNKLKFYDQARYAVGHPLANTPMTGAEAYANYGTDSGPIFSQVGGSIIWRGNFESTLIGPSDESWDQVFIARYPNAGAFLEMVTDPVYQEAVKHRQAAVLTSRLQRFGELELGDTF